MKINVAKKKFLLCFRPVDTEEPIIGVAAGNNNNKQHAQYPRRKVSSSFPKTPSHETSDHHHKRSLSRFFKNLLLANALTKRIRKRRRSTKNSESSPPVTKSEAQTKSSDKDKNIQTMTLDAKIEDAVFPLSPSTSLYSDLTQESTNQNHGGDGGGGGGGCFKVAEQETRGVRRPQMTRKSMVMSNYFYIKRRLIRAVSHRYVIYAVIALFGVAVFWRFNGVFLTCVWLYLAGGPLTPLFSSSGDHRQPVNRRRTR